MQEKIRRLQDLYDYITEKISERNVCGIQSEWEEIEDDIERKAGVFWQEAVKYYRSFSPQDLQTAKGKIEGSKHFNCLYKALKENSPFQFNRTFGEKSGDAIKCFLYVGEEMFEFDVWGKGILDVLRTLARNSVL